MLGRFDRQDWARRSEIAESATYPLLAWCGWSPEHLLVLDLQTGEGAVFRPGGLPAADLNKHRIWVCQLFEPFLGWLYKQDLTLLDDLPDEVELPVTGTQMYGYRRAGAEQKSL